MATKLYKGDKVAYVEYNELDLHLEAGWSVTKEKPAEEVELTNDDIRELAKEAGIEGWENKRISTLKKALINVNQD